MLPQQESNGGEWAATCRINLYSITRVAYVGEIRDGSRWGVGMMGREKVRTGRVDKKDASVGIVKRGGVGDWMDVFVMGY